MKPSDFVYELGSGDGMFVITAARDFGAKAVGIEIDPVRVFISKIMVKIFGVGNKVKIVKSNFFDQDLRQATTVFAYLVPRALERLMPKLKKELKPGTRFISYRYKINLPLVDQDKKNELYLYKIG
ncbi:MAG: hypothetical protein A2857_00920 [Candidatus Levybacteria bacterium RIFCSPHIGHO2_01_FULL_36_15]|nr:MAG: hypothetical protein A2857_00920 [Candidatus Levybacteria bacterium RIFCSPHIGHO2_01_FULL_36_15]OGH37292.1 MAG: hypothetical protein A2905_01120 [Candidatus Levybacteria bacterium RIFCSPLOWO2_01_FULL_36_10]